MTIILRQFFVVLRRLSRSSSFEVLLLQRFNATMWDKFGKKCLIRRTYTSQMPFQSGRTNGSAMPRIHASILKCSFTSSEAQFYSNHVDTMMSRLVVHNKETRRLQWSFGILKKITLACMWSGFVFLDEKIKADTLAK